MIVSKFKFGDKVSYRSCKNAFYLRKTDGIRSLIAVEKFGAIKGGVITVITNELTPATDWIPCSERMPELDVEVLVWFGNFIYIDSLYYEKNLKEYWWQGNCKLPTHWMPLPEMPEVKE